MGCQTGNCGAMVALGLLAGRAHCTGETGDGRAGRQRGVPLIAVNIMACVHELGVLWCARSVGVVLCVANVVMTSYASASRFHPMSSALPAVFCHTHHHHQRRQRGVDDVGVVDDILASLRLTDSDNARRRPSAKHRQIMRTARLCQMRLPARRCLKRRAARQRRSACSRSRAIGRRHGQGRN